MVPVWACSGPLSAVLGTVAAVEETIEAAEHAARSQFVLSSADQSFADLAWQPSPQGRVYWEWAPKDDKSTIIPFDGVPFMLIGCKSLGCHQDRDNTEKQNQKHVATNEHEMAEDDSSKLLQGTERVACPAVLNVTRFAKFPEYKVADKKVSSQRAAAASLRQALSMDPSSVTWEEAFHVRVPGSKDHAGHPVMEQVSEGMKEEEELGPEVPLPLNQMLNKSCVCVRGVAAARELIRRYEVSTVTKFISLNSSRNFGNIDPKEKPHKIQWEHGDKSYTVLPFDGVPFMVLGTKTLECQHGPDRNLIKKQRYAQKKQHDSQERNTTGKRDYKKSGCSAKITLYEVLKFPEYRIPEDSKRRRSAKSLELRRNFLEGNPNQERLFYVRFPSLRHHFGHPVGEMAGPQQPIDSALVNKIHELIKLGVRDVPEMKSHLQNFVKQELFANQDMPARNNTRYFPVDQTIKNHMYCAALKQGISPKNKNEKHRSKKCKVDDDALLRANEMEGCEIIFTDVVEVINEETAAQQVCITIDDGSSTHLASPVPLQVRRCCDLLASLQDLVCRSRDSSALLQLEGELEASKRRLEASMELSDSSHHQQEEKGQGQRQGKTSQIVKYEYAEVSSNLNSLGTNFDANYEA